MSENNSIKYLDKSIGKYVIIDRKTGFSSYQSVEEFRQQNKIHKQKQFFRQLNEIQAINQRKDKTTTVPKNQNKGINQNIDFNNPKESGIDVFPDPELVSTQNFANIETNNRLLEGFSLTSDMKINSSVKLDKTLLSETSLRVIGQIDKKFIVCLCLDRKLIVAFDQHAIHERIRYEKLLKQLYDHQRHVKRVPVLPPIDITLDSNRLKVSFDSYQTQIKTYLGFELNKSAVNENLNNYCVTQIPDCLSDSLDVRSIEEIIREAVIIIGDKIVCNNQRQDISTLRLTPKLLERLQTKACRGAIRFGDSLRLSDCLKLIKSLSKCKTPFRCAHGRASVAPLTYLPKQS